MKIITKLTLAFLTIAFLVLAVGLISTNKSQELLQEEIGTGSALLAHEIMGQIDRTIYMRAETFQIYFNDMLLKEIISNSNKEFDNIEDTQQYIDEKDKEWINAEGTTSFMQEIFDREISQNLRLIMETYKEKYGYEVFGEIFLTNKYGANVAQSGKTSDYYQADEEWWQKAKDEGLYISDVEYDESAAIYSLDICIRIDDENGSLLGILKSVLNIKEMINIIGEFESGESGELAEDDIHRHEVPGSMEFKLLTKDGRSIYSTEEAEVLEDISGQLSESILMLPGITGHASYSIEPGDVANESGLFAHAHSGGYKDFKGLGWILVIEHETEEIFGDVEELKGILFFISLGVMIVAMLIGIFVSRSISSSLNKLMESTVEIGKGNLEIEAEVKTKDEVGNLAGAFNKMTIDLKKSQKELQKHSRNLEKEVKARTKQLNEKVDESEKSKSATMNMMEDLTDSLEKQKQLEKIKTEFLSVTSHELRTPITPMRGQLEMTLGEFFGKLNEEQKKSLNLVHRNTLILDRLIGDILDISKMESGNMKFIMEKANIADVLKDAVETMNLKATEKNIVLELKSETFPDSVLDKDRIRQLVVNLINNAIKFTDTNGKITVEAVNGGKKATIKVVDTGIGIAKEDSKRIFNPFEQVDSTAGRRYEGSGLGLAICHGIALRHGGTIWVDSEPGKGSTFAFTLPYKIRNDTQRMQVELFTETKKSAISRFKRLAEAEGYSTIAGNEEELVTESYIRADGRLKPDVSFAQLEVKGYLKKKTAKDLKSKTTKDLNSKK